MYNGNNYEIDAVIKLLNKVCEEPICATKVGKTKHGARDQGNKDSLWSNGTSETAATAAFSVTFYWDIIVEIVSNKI